VDFYAVKAFIQQIIDNNPPEPNSPDSRAFADLEDALVMWEIDDDSIGDSPVDRSALTTGCGLKFRRRITINDALAFLPWEAFMDEHGVWYKECPPAQLDMMLNGIVRLDPADDYAGVLDRAHQRLLQCYRLLAQPKWLGSFFGPGAYSTGI
jgi:hypothetical protein